ncbi:PaaI family thioesterase [Sorangium sp. So ce1000]|uniref:PaaI family thioesterase n=1 Tax=Sorangium sp. So ce1000 TaxID=3133325 RepID=UPI003F6064BA
MVDMQSADALERVREQFKKAAFVADVGIELAGLGPGWAETSLPVAARHGQAEQFVHAGVQATMADHTAGAAAGTLVGADEVVVTVEYKINFLKPARGDRLRCRADVLRHGRTLSVVEARVYAGQDETKPVAAAMLTLAIISAPSRG